MGKVRSRKSFLLEISSPCHAKELTPRDHDGGVDVDVDVDGEEGGDGRHYLPASAEAGLSESGKQRRRMLMLSVAYAANVGGTGVMTGSPPNLVLPQVSSVHCIVPMYYSSMRSNSNSRS